MPCMMVQTRYVFERVDLSGKESVLTHLPAASQPCQLLFAVHCSSHRPPAADADDEVFGFNVLGLSKAHASNPVQHNSRVLGTLVHAI